jgi:hypothetical protein
MRVAPLWFSSILLLLLEDEQLGEGHGAIRLLCKISSEKFCLTGKTEAHDSTLDKPAANVQVSPSTLSIITVGLLPNHRRVAIASQEAIF